VKLVAFNEHRYSATQSISTQTVPHPSRLLFTTVLYSLVHVTLLRPCLLRPCLSRTWMQFSQNRLRNFYLSRHAGVRCISARSLSIHFCSTGMLHWLLLSCPGVVPWSPGLLTACAPLLRCRRQSFPSPLHWRTMLLLSARCSASLQSAHSSLQSDPYANDLLRLPYLHM
jgi:hypothetical protein